MKITHILTLAFMSQGFIHAADGAGAGFPAGGTGAGSEVTPTLTDGSSGSGAGYGAATATSLSAMPGFGAGAGSSASCLPASSVVVAGVEKTTANPTAYDVAPPSAGVSPFGVLGPDLLGCVAGFLPPKDLGRFASTCKAGKEASRKMLEALKPEVTALRACFKKRREWDNTLHDKLNRAKALGIGVPVSMEAFPADTSDHSIWAFIGNGTITELYLNSNKIGDGGADALAGALSVNSTLTRLYLSKNHIHVKGAVAIARALMVNHTLRALHLSCNNIGDEVAGALAGALRENHTLTTLYLNSNKIGAEGARAIAGALRVNRTLTKLNLNWNDIGDAGAVALAGALRVNSALRILDLGLNHIGDEMKAKLREICDSKGIRLII